MLVKMLMPNDNATRMQSRRLRAGKSGKDGRNGVEIVTVCRNAEHIGVPCPDRLRIQVSQMYAIVLNIGRGTQRSRSRVSA